MEYHVAGSCPAWARGEVQSAFSEWQLRTAVAFVEAAADGPSRITVRCVPRQHECPYPFNGVLAHAFAPPTGTPEPLAGDIHLNMEARDTAGNEWDWQAPGRLRAVVMHEIGHTLGLGHLSNTDAVMNDVYRGPFRHLTLEDLTYAAELLMVRNVVPAGGLP